MSDGIFEGIKTYHGTGEIGEEISDTVNDINAVLRPNTIELSNEIAIDRMNIKPFRVSLNVNINKPVLLSCERTRINQFKLTAAPFDNPGFIHTESVWQLALDSNFSVGVLELESDVQLLTALFNLVKIEYSTVYYARVKFKANAFTSAWSDTLNITTAAPVPVDTPTVNLVEQYDDEDEKKFRITASAYRHTDPLLLHTRTVWQVSKASNFGTILKEIPDTLAPLTYAEFLIDPVESVTDYFFRAKYFSNLIESAWSSPYLLKTRLLGSIEKPVLTVVNPICPFNFTISGSAYDVSNPDFYHTHTHWQVSTRVDFATTIVDFTTPDDYPDLTTLIVSEELCVDQTTYYARAKYLSEWGEIESEWGDPTTCELKMTIEEYPQRVDFTNIVTAISESQTYLIECDKKPCLGYVDADGMLTFETLALDSEGNKTKLVSFPTAIDANPKDMAVCSYEKPGFQIDPQTDQQVWGYSTLIYQISSEQDIEGDFFWVVREFNKTTGQTVVFASILHSTFNGRDGAEFATPVAMFRTDNALWVVGESTTQTLIFPVNPTTKVWSPAFKYDRPVDSKYTCRYCLTQDGNIGCLDLFTYTELSTTTGQWAVPAMTGIELVLPDYSSKVGATWDCHLKAVFPKDDTFLAIVEIVASFTPNPFFCFFLFNQMTGAWERLTDVPGIADFTDPTFGLIDGGIYVTSVRYGITLPLYVSNLYVNNTPMGSFFGSKKPQYESCVFSHYRNGELLVGICCMDQPVESFPYVYGYSLTNQTTGATTKTEVDFGEYGVPFNASFCYGNGKLYFCSGLYAGQFTTLLLAWDLEEETMSLVSSEAPGSERFSMICSGDRIFFHGGYGTTWTDSRVYDLTTHTWVKDLLFDLRKTDSRMVEIPMGILIYEGTNPSNPEDDKAIYLWNKETLAISFFGMNAHSTVSDYTLVVHEDKLLSIRRYPIETGSAFSVWQYSGSINEPTGGAFAALRDIPLLYEACPSDWLTSDTPAVLDPNYSFTVGGAKSVMGTDLFLMVNAYRGGMNSLQGGFTSGGTTLVRLVIGLTVNTSYYLIRGSNRYDLQVKILLSYPTFSSEPQGGVRCEFNCTYSHPEGGGQDIIVPSPPLRFFASNDKSNAAIANTTPIDANLGQMNPQELYPSAGGNLSVRARLSAANLNWSSWSNFLQLPVE